MSQKAAVRKQVLGWLSRDRVPFGLGNEWAIWRTRPRLAKAGYWVSGEEGSRESKETPRELCDARYLARGAVRRLKITLSLPAEKPHA